MLQKVIKVGNSAAVTIPKDFLDQTGIKPGDKVMVDADRVSESMSVYKAGSKNNKSSITPEFLDTVKKINQRYGPALRKLAEK